jgi:hypothetical protein
MIRRQRRAGTCPGGNEDLLVRFVGYITGDEETGYGSGLVTTHRHCDGFI